MPPTVIDELTRPTLFNFVMKHVSQPEYERYLCEFVSSIGEDFVPELQRILYTHITAVPEARLREAAHRLQ